MNSVSQLSKLFSECHLCFRPGITRIPSRNAAIRQCSTLTKVENVVPSTDKKMSKAMQAYLERSRKYTEFIKKEEQAFNIGKRHLANMMGCDPETFTQEQIDEAIEYLFPSGLFEKKARPFLKPPHLVFPSRKDAQFDESGRPYHFFFYTGKPNFYNIMHESVGHLKILNDMDESTTNKALKENVEPLDLSGSEWLSKEELQRSIVETLSDYEYKNFTQVMDRLASHMNSRMIQEYMMKYRKLLMETSMSFAPTKPDIDVDGRSYILTTDCPRKSARADVKVISPGSGLISINGKGIDYFSWMQSRNQILFPLELTGLRDSVDIEATVKGGGQTGQAGAIRWGISWGLRCFVSPEMFETMRLAGLLTRDYRRRERKKPGQAKARKKFTWKKR